MEFQLLNLLILLVRKKWGKFNILKKCRNGEFLVVGVIFLENVTILIVKLLEKKLFVQLGLEYSGNFKKYKKLNKILIKLF